MNHMIWKNFIFLAIFQQKDKQIVDFILIMNLHYTKLQNKNIIKKDKRNKNE